MSSRTISNVASELIPRNRLRKSLIFQNEDSTDIVYIKRESPQNTTVSSTDHDHRIAPGGLITLNYGTDGQEAIQDRWTCIASANTPRVSLFETEDALR